jgi:hypothetical protein
MPSNVGATVARKANAIAREIDASRRTALGDAGLVLKRSVEDARARVAPSGRLRNVGKGARLNVRYDVEGERQVKVKVTGPWPIIEENTKAHTVQPKKRKGKKAIAFNGMARASAQHPGTKGKHPFRKGIEAGQAKAVRALGESIGTAAQRGIRA